MLSKLYMLFYFIGVINSSLSAYEENLSKTVEELNTPSVQIVMVGDMLMHERVI